MAFADWVVMGNVVGEVTHKISAAGPWARVRVASSGPRGRMFATVWAYGKVADTARDVLRNGTPVTLRGYFAPDTSRDARQDSLALIASQIDFVKTARESDGDDDDGPPSHAIVETHRDEPTYSPGKAAEVREKLAKTAQEAREGSQEGEVICPLRKAPCKRNCAVLETCQRVSEQT